MKSKFIVLKGFGVRPPMVALLQTNGSFGAKFQPLSRTASLLITPKGNLYTYSKTYDNHTDSFESEWCSVLDGIQYAIRKGQRAIELENDNMSVIRSLVSQQEPRRPHFAVYFEEINRCAEGLDYLSVRWIPRRLNRAHDIFRLAT